MATPYEPRQNTAPGNFPATRYSAIIALRGGDPAERQRAFDLIAQIYWRPVYTHIRMKWKRDREAAADLTQGFFLEAIQKEFFADFDPMRARFRTFLRTCLDRYVQNHDAAATRLKRGGETEILPLDIEALESGSSNMSDLGKVTPEDAFETEWVRSLMSSAVQRLKNECARDGRDLAFRLFERYDLAELDGTNSLTYAQLAAEYSVSIETVTNHLAAARREFRRIVLELIREMTASEAEYRDEVRSVLGTSAP